MNNAALSRNMTDIENGTMKDAMRNGQLWTIVIRLKQGEDIVESRIEEQEASRSATMSFLV